MLFAGIRQGCFRQAIEPSRLQIKVISKMTFNHDTILIPNGRVKDWLYGVRAAQPDRETQNSLTSQPLTEAERYRIVYHMITNPKEEGGAGITPKQGHWKNVESIFPLHDQKFNNQWIRKWSTMTFLRAEDLDEIRDHLGEKVSCDIIFPLKATYRYRRLPFTLRLPSPTSLS